MRWLPIFIAFSYSSSGSLLCLGVPRRVIMLCTGNRADALLQGARFSYSLPAHAGTMQTPSPSAFNAVSPLASPPSSTSSGVSSLGPFRINSGVLTSSHQLQQLQQSQPLTMVTSGLSFPTSSSAVTPMLPGPASQPSRLADPFSLCVVRVACLIFVN